MKKILISIILLSNVFCYFSCQDALDKEDLETIPDPKVWSDPKLATAVINNLYLSLPTWNVSYSDACEEATRKNSWNDGTATIDNGGPSYWPYVDIRKVNQFLQDIDGPMSTIEEPVKNRLKGEAQFIRAYIYFEMVKRYGGIPLITVPQDRNDDLLVKRNSTKECFDFVLNELLEATNRLPDNYDADNIGRTTKGAAMALRARAWLFRASPQFNPTNNTALWDSAYTANKTTMEYLQSKGAGLVDKYTTSELYLKEMNKEVVFAIRYLDPSRTHNRDAAVRPIDFSANAAQGSNPTQKMVDAYPLKSGKKTTWNDPVYGGDATKSWQNRDDRFYTSIVYNGTYYLNTVMQLNSDATNNGYSYGKSQATLTGYYCRKGVDESLTRTTCQKSGVDYIDIRYAELMMNYAEAACELGKLPEAFDVLKAIRKRAGINETTPEDPDLVGKLYGLNPNMTKSEMRQALRDERFIEFAFEQKRLWDLRRWMIMHEVMVGRDKRHALVLTTSAGAPGGFTYTLTDKDDSPMIYNANMYFLPMSTASIQGNKNLEQTKGWGSGTFDPQAGL